MSSLAHIAQNDLFVRFDKKNGVHLIGNGGRWKVLISKTALGSQGGQYTIPFKNNWARVFYKNMMSNHDRERAKQRVTNCDKSFAKRFWRLLPDGGMRKEVMDSRLLGQSGHFLNYH